MQRTERATAMTSRKKSFSEFWRSKKEGRALLQKTDQLRLSPSQLRRLLGDSGARAELQNTKMAPLLPPVGTEVFRRFTPASLNEIKQKEQKGGKNKEVTGEEPSKPTSDLEAGKPLPYFYGAPPTELLNTPLEELDPFYQSQKTFMVLSKGNIIHRFNADPVFFQLSPFSLLRMIAIKILIHSLFSLFIVLTILTNCVFMVMTDPPAWSQIAEYVFIAIYTFEAVIKIVSRGFWMGHFTFLRDPWNWLDVIIICMAYLTEFADLGNIPVMSVFRDIRVLKIIALIPGLRTTVGSLAQSVKRLANVFILSTFTVSFFALIGLQLFMGSLNNKCVMKLLGNLTYDSFSYSYSYHYNYSDNTGSTGFKNYINNQENHYFIPSNIDALLCGNRSDAGVCPEGYHCLNTGRNPNYGFTSYDTYGWALLSTLRLITQDFWENLAQLTMRSEGKMSMIYIVVVLFLGSFYLTSLFLAAVAMVTADQSEASVAEAKRREEEFNEIQQALKKREENLSAQKVNMEEETELFDKKDSAPQKKNLAAEIKNHKQEHTDIEGFEEHHRSCPPCCFSFADLFLKWNCCGCWLWLKQRLYTFVMDPFFEVGITVCIILNTIFMSMEHYPMTLQFEELLIIANLVFTAIFVLEMILKIVAMDPYGYFQVSWNIFDSTIVIISLLELTLADVEGLSVLLSFRLLRVVRLAKRWPSFNMLIRLMAKSMGALRNLTLVLVIMVFFFSITGLHLFRKDYVNNVCRISADCMLPRWHMGDFIHAFLVIFRILGGEWIETMWDCMEVSGQSTCLIFYMMVLVIGKLLILSLFMALLLTNLATPEEEEGENYHQVTVNQRRAVSWTKDWILEHICRKPVNPDDTAVNNKEDNKKEYLALTFVTSDQPVSEAKRAPIADEVEFKTPESEEKQQPFRCDDVQKVQENKDDKDCDVNTPEDCCCDECCQCGPFLDIDTSRGGWRVWSNFRRCCFTIVENKLFECFITIIILLSCVALVFEDIYLEKHQVLKMVLEHADLVFTCVFVMEMILKVIALGSKRYFTNNWCRLDFLVVIASVLSVTGNMLGYSDLTPIKCVRALRTLSRFHGTRVVVHVLLRVAPSIMDVLLMSLTVWLIFSILGVRLFAGKFYYCYNETSEEIFSHEQINNKSDCFALIETNFTEIRWKRFIFNFDSVISGYLSLLQLATFKGWLDIMYAAVDSTQVEHQPVYENNIYMFLYCICFIICCFFNFNFFIRVFIDKLNQLRDKFGEKHIFFTEEQKKIYRTKKAQLFRLQTPVRPQNSFQALVFDLVIRRCFELLMMLIICINMVTMMMETVDQSFKKEFILYWFHFVFVLIYLIESVLKIIALGRSYFRDNWNVLDFVLVVLSILGLFFADLIEKYFFSVDVIRFVRIFRILPLIPGTERIRSLLRALVMSLPALFNIGLVLFFVMFTFSVFGMSTFAHVKKAALIDDMVNFETFWNSMTCMFIVTTTAGWDGVLHPIMVTIPDCDPNIEHPGTSVRGDCGKPTAGAIFLTSYIIFSFLLLVSMFVTIILEIFDMDADDSSEPLSDDDLQMFYDTWKTFDPDASQSIEYSKLSEFCDSLKDPLRIPKPNTIKLINMDLPLLPGDKIHYLDILLAIRAQVFGDSGQVDALKANMEEKFKDKNTSKISCEPISSTLRRKQEEVAAAVIQRAYRKQRVASREGTEGQTGQLNGDAKETVMRT